MSSKNQTRSILKKRPLSHKKTLRFKPDEELVLVRQISNKSADDGTNWRRRQTYNKEDEFLSRREAKQEREEFENESEQKLLPLLLSIKNSKNSELSSIRRLNVTKKQKAKIEKLFKPRTKEQEEELVSTFIQLSRSRHVPLNTLITAVETASRSPPKSRLERVFDSIKSIFRSSKRGGKRTKKYRKRSNM
jgi:hypothetical protein